MRKLASLLLAVAMLSGCTAFGQTAEPKAVPKPLLTAKKVFISNAGADSVLFPSPYSGKPDRAYNEFYAAVASIGRFQLVDDPGMADLVLVLRLTLSEEMVPKYVNPILVGMVRLQVVDTKTHFTLWTITQTIDHAMMQKSSDKNFDEAIAAVTAELKRFTMTPAP